MSYVKFHMLFHKMPQIVLSIFQILVNIDPLAQILSLIE